MLSDPSANITSPTQPAHGVDAPSPSLHLSEMTLSASPEAKSASSPAVGNLSRYLVKTFHARGGMGEVWLSHDPHLGREVALKRLLTSSGVARERFLAEAQVTGQLEHPGIVPVHDIGSDELGQPFYIMKFVRGRSLKQVIAEYQANRGATDGSAELQCINLLQVFVDVCHAIAYAHSRGVLHRDIKPDNIMIGQYGETVVLDWGLSKVKGVAEAGVTSAPVDAVSGSVANTAAGSVIGSPLYMPPEMAHGRIADLDERTDVYLLGATLYEILTCKPPREGRSIADVLDIARAAGAPVAPRKHCNVDKPIEAICLKAMAGNPDERYANVAALIKDVQRYLADEPVSAWKEDWGRRVLRWSRRHRKAIRRWAALIICIVLTLFLWSKWRQLEARRFLAARQAAELQQREQGRLQIARFDKLVDEARFYAASTDPVNEHAPYFDSAKARVAAETALSAAAAWGDEFNQLPFPQEAPRLRNRVYELLLLMAQDRLRNSQPSSVADARAYLERARQLNVAPSWGFNRLIAQCRLQAHPTTAASDQPATAFDFFLLAEEARRRSPTDDSMTADASDIEARRSQSLDEAIADYRCALKTDPTLFWAHFQLARCYMAQGNTAEAVEVLGTCIALRPDVPWGYSTRGMALGLLGRFDDAAADLDFAIRINPDFQPAMLNRGAVYLLQGRRDAALADFTAVLKAPLNTRLSAAAFYRAQMFVQTGELDRAITDLDSVVAAEPAFSAALILRARVHLLQGAQAACVSDLDQWLQLSHHEFASKQRWEPLEQRGQTLRTLAADLPNSGAQAALHLALSDLKAAQAMGDSSSRLYANLGAVLDLQGNLPAAIDAYQQALHENPADLHTRLNCAWAYQKCDQYVQAHDQFSLAATADPNNAEAHAGLAYIAACTGHADDARAEVSRSLLMGSADYLILHNIACVYARLSDSAVVPQRDQAVAIALLQQAIDLSRKKPHGPDELTLIAQEPAFSATFRGTPEFKSMVGMR